MNADHERFAEWDAAYVVGALSPADRRAFEAHLEGCDLCRAAIAELAPVTGLLSRVDADHALTMLAADAAEVDSAVGRDALLRRGQADTRRRRRLRWGVFALAAALLVVAAIAVPVAISSQTPKLETVAFEKLVDAPITASVELDPVEWGTRIDLDCAYGTDGAGDVEPPADGWPYALVVTGQDGTESEVSSWRSWPDSHAWVTAGTALGRDQIKSMEIRSLTTGAVLMRAEVDGR